MSSRVKVSEGKNIRGIRQEYERIRQGKKGQEKSSCDKRGKECIEGERQTQEGNVEDQSR